MSEKENKQIKTLLEIIDDLRSKIKEQDLIITELRSRMIKGSKKLTKKQEEIFKEIEEYRKISVDIPVGKIAEKLNISPSLVSYTAKQIIKRGI